jgi:hypothetical protein
MLRITMMIKQENNKLRKQILNLMRQDKIFNEMIIIQSIK